jgi:hypothetical protein
MIMVRRLSIHKEYEDKMSKKNKMPRYFGIKISDSVREAILSEYGVSHENVHCSHITLHYKPSQEEIEAIWNPIISKTVAFSVVSHHKNEKVQCIYVKLHDDSIQCGNKYPHITISTSKEGQAKDSNDLIESEIESNSSDSADITNEVVFYGSINAFYY